MLLNTSLLKGTSRRLVGLLLRKKGTLLLADLVLVRFLPLSQNNLVRSLVLLEQERLVQRLARRLVLLCLLLVLLRVALLVLFSVHSCLKHFKSSALLHKNALRRKVVRPRMLLTLVRRHLLLLAVVH